jgi:hypothetical protein
MNHYSGFNPYVIKERNEEITCGSRDTCARIRGRRLRVWSPSH